MPSSEQQANTGPSDGSGGEDIEHLLSPPSKSTSPSLRDQLRREAGMEDVSRRRSNAVGVGALLMGHLRYYWAVYRLEICLGGILLIAVGLAVSGVLGRADDPFKHAQIQHDWSEVTSEHDFELGKIDHWCLRGDDDSCRCEDPLVPSGHHLKHWMRAHKMNTDKIESIIQASVASSRQYPPYQQDEDWLDKVDDDWKPDYSAEDDGEDGDVDGGVDVAFIGDSITESRAGLTMGMENKKYLEVKKVFNKEFNKSEGGEFDGIALGVSGDTCPNLLWRVLNGEMPSDFNPKVWWVHIGVNDLRRTQCSEEVVLLGILRIVEEIRSRKPTAYIVLNSILPTTSDARGQLTSKVSSKIRTKKIAGVDLWPSILSINEELKRFAEKHKKVKFFDATAIFTEQKGDKLYMNMDLMLDEVHPNAAGHKAWGKAIATTLQHVIG